MGTLADKLAYLSDTKSAIRTAISSDSITDDTPFRSYADIITDKLNNVVYQEVIGNAVSITDAINAKFDSIKIFGKSTQDGTPTSANPIDIVSLDCTSATLNIDDVVLSLPDIGDFQGVPVDSGGVYTDANGQQWLCDYVDLIRGVYVQYCVVYDSFVKNTNYNLSNVNAFTCLNSAYANIINGDGTSTGGGKALCTLLPQSSYQYSTNNIEHFYFYLKSGTANVFISNAVDEAFVIANLKVIGTLQTPIVTPLTEAQLEAFKNLYTSANGTSLTNSMGADMAVIYLKR